MEHRAFYRKYRPSTFKDVLGQEHVVDVLSSALKNGGISHAYLFSGSRGTGKTSVARILASGLGTSEKDLYEIDAASNRGIDDVRELREAVNTMPFDSDKKVYIIDEVHMLTKEAFNALLKTLEEPPEHVVFVLATTEPHKLPDTVISRCEVHEFKKPSRDLLKKVLTDTAKKEGYTLEAGSGELIALLADGSFRDGLGVLQKILTNTKGKEVTIDAVENATGAPKSELVNQVIESLDTQDADKGIKAVGEAVSNNVDMKLFAKLILEKLRAVLLLRFAKDASEMLKDDFAKEDMEFLRGVAKNKESKISSETLKEFLDAYTAIGHSYIAQLPLELAIIKLTGQSK